MSVYVFGGSNVDIHAKAVDDIILRDSNVAHVSTSFGGVARNVAENIANLDTKVHFVSVFGNDINADSMRTDLREKGVDISYSFDVDAAQSLYLDVLDSENDMYVALNDMGILDALNDTDLDELANIVTDKDIVFIDANFKEEVISYVLRDFKGFKVVDATSGVKCNKIYNHLAYIDLLKVNKAEAKELTDIEIKDDKDYLFAIKKFKELGVKEVVITASFGFFYADSKAVYKYSHNSEKEVINTTGAGDSLSAGLVVAKAEGYERDYMLKFALSMARVNIQSVNTVASFDKDMIADRANNNNYTGELVYEF